jgi:hypothetical protein
VSIPEGIILGLNTWNITLFQTPRWPVLCRGASNQCSCAFYLSSFTYSRSGRVSNGMDTNNMYIVSIAAGLRAGRPRFDSWQGLRSFSALHRVQTGPGAQPASNRMGTGSSFPVVKRPGREADQSPPSSVEMNLIKYRDNFSVYLFMFMCWLHRICSSVYYMRTCSYI